MFRGLLFIILLSAISCGRQQEMNQSIVTGDLVFIGNSSSDLSGAIDAVTKTSQNTSFSHMGLIVVEDHSTKVIHSNSYKGVCIESLDSFRLNSATSRDSLYIFRIDKEINWERVLTKADGVIGDSYNRTYVMEDEGFYCSELIYYLLEQDSVFKLNPMTFLNPETDQYHQTWVDYYEKLGLEIPQGKLGCNPNGMANNPLLQLITKL